MSGGVKKSNATREARDAEHHLLRMTTTLPKKEVFFALTIWMTTTTTARHLCTTAAASTMPNCPSPQVLRLREQASYSSVTVDTFASFQGLSRSGRCRCD